MGLAPDAAALLAADPETAAYFERAAAAAEGIEARVVANWVTGELAAALRQDGERPVPPESKVEPESLAALVGDGPGEEDLPRQRQGGAGDPGRRGRRPGGDRRARGPRPDLRLGASWSR